MYQYYNLETDKNDAITAAKDLGYGKDVINRIKNAKTGEEVSRIMATARHNKR